jgi:hypothetical protein
MKENEDKNIEQYVHAVIKETPLESPSPDFTAKVMASVLALNKNKATVYKPLISKTGWALIFAGIIVTLAYFIINSRAQVVSQPWSFGTGVKDFIRPFSDSHLFQFSRTTIKVIILSTILMIIQITLLKNYLDKRVAK